MRLVHGRPQGRPFFFLPLPALLVAGACASLPPATPPVVRSSLGDVAAPALRAALERAARERPELAAWPGDPAVTRGFLEEWLFAEALAQEARRAGLDATPEARATLAGLRREALAKVLEQRLEAALPPATDEQVEAFLRANVALVRRGERLSLRHVFKRVAGQAPAGERARVRAEVEALRQRAIQGDDFGHLAREHSDSETAKFDGQIAPQARGQLPASVEDVVWSLAPGEISGVVETPIGFHVFRLEARLPADELPADEQRAWARLRLRHQARAEARRRERQQLLAASGAQDASAALPPWRAEPATPVFRLGPDTLTVADLLRARERRAFAERHRTSLSELAEPETWRRLLAWRADQEGLWNDPEVTAEVGDAERTWLAEQAYARRLERWQGALPETELRAFFDGHPRRFDEPARLRLRVVVLHRAPGGRPTPATSASRRWLARCGPVSASWPTWRARCPRTRARPRAATWARSCRATWPSGPARPCSTACRSCRSASWAGPTCWRSTARSSWPWSRRATCWRVWRSGWPRGRAASRRPGPTWRPRSRATRRSWPGSRSGPTCSARSGPSSTPSGSPLRRPRADRPRSQKTPCMLLR